MSPGLDNVLCGIKISLKSLKSCRPPQWHLTGYTVCLHSENTKHYHVYMGGISIQGSPVTSWREFNSHYVLAFLFINMFNTLRPRQNGRHFADEILNFIFLNENVWIPIKISLKVFPKGPIDNIPSLVQIMGWRRSGDKPLSEPMMVRLPTHICVARPQWVNSLVPRRYGSSFESAIFKLINW